MVSVKDIRDTLATRGWCSANKLYCYKMPEGDNLIGIYNYNGGDKTPLPMGGVDNRGYYARHISILVHWSKSATETELKAMSVYTDLQSLRNVNVGSDRLIYVDMIQDEPVDVNTADDGTFEYVIDCKMYFEKK